jgi:hypothetical protein
MRKQTDETKPTNGKTKMNLTIDSIKAGYAAANSAYIARKGGAANLNKAGMNPDIAKGLRVWSNMTAPTFDAVIGLCAGLDIVAGIEKSSNTKKAMRLPMLLSFIVSGDVRDLKGSARTAFLECCALVNGAANRESLTFAATGAMRDGDATSTLRDVSLARKLRTLAGSVKSSTEQTQNSVAFSAGGLSDMLGIARKDTRKSHPILNAESLVLRAMLDRINRTSESTLFELTQTESDGHIAPEVFIEGAAVLEIAPVVAVLDAVTEVTATPAPIVKGKKNKGMKKGSK